ncbi:lecithin retinol acyltransferase family protein [Clostridium sp. FP1]|uniref:lecithin retinol acyltransferase family protein n=1 Tax=Clostridium sp. FP1 TaxID=2724076 RepID=UPI0013E8FC71|nr:lecithin retinol acyltransferase family protein [Clostridium sp. FP1]MBZ9634683.1 lecithin retinol acyltransferase family protein [Clostridium sp. FP1]
MGILGKSLFDIITDGGIVPKSPTTRIVEKIVHSVSEKAVEKLTSNGTNKKGSKSVGYGDVIGVRRTGYKHFGIYLNDYCIIHYASRSGDFGKDICIHETTIEKFLDGSNSYFVCKFSKSYGKPSEFDIKASLSSSSFVPQWDKLFRTLKGFNYNLYSPEETVQRAHERMGESKYNLVTNNCEHFAIWCKTGISESHQVNDILGDLPFETIYT